jgi:hypothetical protein
VKMPSTPNVKGKTKQIEKMQTAQIIIKMNTV